MILRNVRTYISKDTVSNPREIEYSSVGIREHKTAKRLWRNVCNILMYSITLLCNVIILHIMNMQFRIFRAVRLTSVIYSKHSKGQT
jgi:hypothetical protein